MLPAVRILVFLHGTAIMHPTAVGRLRGRARPPVPAARLGSAGLRRLCPHRGGCGEVRSWQHHGAIICYVSSQASAPGADLDRAMLGRHGFPTGTVYFRQPGEDYASVARRGSRCGGRRRLREHRRLQPHHRSKLCGDPRSRRGCIIVPEFGGLAHLPGDPAQLATTARSHRASPMRSASNVLVRLARPTR
jgi:hypothetical protein